MAQEQPILFHELSFIPAQKVVQHNCGAFFPPARRPAKAAHGAVIRGRGRWRLARHCGLKKNWLGRLEFSRKVSCNWRQSPARRRYFTQKGPKPWNCPVHKPRWWFSRCENPVAERSVRRRLRVPGNLPGKVRSALAALTGGVVAARRTLPDGDACYLENPAKRVFLPVWTLRRAGKQVSAAESQGRRGCRHVSARQFWPPPGRRQLYLPARTQEFRRRQLFLPKLPGWPAWRHVLLPLPSAWQRCRQRSASFRSHRRWPCSRDLPFSSPWLRSRQESSPRPAPAPGWRQRFPRWPGQNN